MKDDEITDDEKLYLKALYQLSLEACGGKVDVLHSLKGQENMPKIYGDDVMKRFLELKEKEENDETL